MADVTISYKKNEIATMNATGVKTLLTGDTFCEDDIVVAYTKPATPAPNLQGKTVYPSASDQTTTPDQGYDGLSSVTSKGVLLTNLTADNIKKDVVVKIGDADDDDRIISITGTYTGAASTYSVTITLTNPSLPNAFGSFGINEQITDGWQDWPPSGEGDRIGSISSPTGSTTITIDSANYGFSCIAFGTGMGDVDWTRASISCTGGVAYMGGDNMGSYVFQVTGDGTATISGLLWDDD